MVQLTDKQHETLKAIADFTKKYGMPPSFAELRVILGISSNQSLLDRLNLLDEKGLVTRDTKRHRSILISAKGTAYLEQNNQSRKMKVNK